MGLFDRKKFSDLTPEEKIQFQLKTVSAIKWAIPYLIACFVVDVFCLRMRYISYGQIIPRDIIFALLLDVVVIYWSRLMWRNRQIRKDYKEEIKEHKRKRRESFKAQFRGKKG